MAKIDLFRSLGPQAIAILDTQCTWRKYSRNEWVVEYHEATTDVFFVLSGVVRLKIPAASGREVLFKDLDAGGFIGEIAAIDGEPSATGILAYTDVVIARMPRGVFRTVLDHHPDVRDQVLLRAAKIIHALTDRVRDFSMLDVRHRIYAELLRLAQPKAGAENRASISPPPTQAAIAARVSTRREAVAREMKALERAGLIERTRGALLLNDTVQLRRMIKRACTGDDTDFDVEFV
ncbi:Crp/Fnr family transcriptional regulator [Pseudorhodoplanes sinuspersici]|uniref:Crp/Fnr family transcriptional regulator n=1 Tax=Pseudorhodoplanes sinuspersici TaxID=1235591 RepID=UPI0018DF4085|nr:Crp/Fnr family transcriptional regulator [Pseudorhodoplanes sinuspersici]